jgi:GT2 family glycosyltransferase
MENPAQEEFPPVSIIVLSYNSAKLGLLFYNCVESFLKTDYPNFEVIIMDGGSDPDDNSARDAFERFRQKTPRIRYHRSQVNRGWTGNNNEAFKLISEKSKYVVFANNDVVVRARWLTPLVEVAVHHTSLGAVGPSGAFLTNGFIPIGLSPQGLRKYREPYSVNHVLGHCLMTPTRLFKVLGGFNENLFTYFDEVDYCMRLRYHGYESCAVPESESNIEEHRAGSSFKANKLLTRRSYWISRNSFFVSYQNKSSCTLLVSIGCIFLNRTRRFLSLVAHKDIDDAAAVARGMREGLIHIKRGVARTGRAPFHDNRILPVITDLLYSLMPQSLVQMQVRSIVERNLQLLEHPADDYVKDAVAS